MTDLLSVLPPAVRIGGVVGWNDIGETGTVTAEFKRRDHTADQVAKLGSDDVQCVWEAAINVRKPGA